jgi:hypothetical protein
MKIQRKNDEYTVTGLDLDDLKALEYALNIASNKIDGMEVQLQGFVPLIAQDARKLSSEISNQLDAFLAKKK